MATGAVIARILTQYSDKGSKEAQKDIARLTKKFDDFGKKAKKSFGIAIAASATLAVKIGTDAVQAAIEDSKSQLVLANALKVTADANGKLTEAAEDYIEKTMFRTNTADELLRASLAQLIIATGDLTQAEKLQTIALDVAAFTGKDLAAVTIAMTKAQQGNVDALKRLSPELSGLITKGMKAEEAFALLGATYYGSAEALANLDPLTKLKLAYGEVLETLGYELLPVIQEFATYVIENVIPAIDEWIKANGDELREALVDIVEGVIALSGVFRSFAEFIQENEFLIKLAIQIYAIGRGTKILGKFMSKIDELIGKVGKSAKTVGTEFKKLTDKFWDFLKTDQDGLFGRIVQLIGIAAENAAKLAGSILLVKLAYETVSGTIKDLLGLQDEQAKGIDKVTKKTYNQMRADQIKADADKKRAEALKKAQEAAAAAAAKAAAEEAKRAKLEAAVQSKILSIRKSLNITKDSAIDKETDLIQLAAAEKFLAKQGVVAKQELAKLERLKEENFLLEVRDTLAKRYVDIQKVLADQKLDLKEIEDLAKKWGISNQSAEMYIHLVQSINDGTISNAEVEKLAMMWGSTNEQAKAFLETYLRIHDGILDEKEVFDLLQQGWAKTEDEVRFYADAVAIIHDGIAKDEDFQRLADKWDKSREEVNKYIGSMGAKFDYQGTFLDPVIALAVMWDSATDALDRYLKLLKTGQGFTFGVTPPTVPTTPVTPVTPVVPTTPGGKPEVQIPDGIMPSAQAAIVYAVAKAAGDMETAAKAAAQVTPTVLAAAESGAIGAASIAAQLKAAEEKVAYAATLAGFKEKEAREAAEAAVTASTMDYDERFRFRSTLMSNASGIPAGNLMAAPVVNVTVQGNVTTEQDLVQAVRNGLLATQYNGNQLLLEAI